MSASAAAGARSGSRGEGRAPPGPGSSNPSDGGSGSDGTGNLGHLVHHLEQVSKLIGGGIGTDLDPIVDAGGPPGRGVEPARRGHTDPCQVDTQRRGFAVEVIEDAAGCREMEQMPAGEIGVQSRRTVRARYSRLIPGSAFRAGGAAQLAKVTASRSVPA